MLDLSQLNAWLAGLGPWGILIGAALTIALQWLKNRNTPTPAPAPAPSPTPAPEPTPAPGPVAPRFPLLNRLGELLAKIPLKDIVPLLLPLVMTRKNGASEVVLHGEDLVAVAPPSRDPVEEEMLKILREQIDKSLKV